VPEDEAPYYAEAIRRGATLISLHSDETLRAEELIHRYGTINIHERISLWRQDGWKGFDTETVLAEGEAKPAWEIVSVTTKETTSTKLSPISASPIAIVEVAPPIETEPKIVELNPLLEEPQIADEDTAKAIPRVEPLSNETLRTLIINEAEMDHTAEQNEFPEIEAATSHPKE